MKKRVPTATKRNGGPSGTTKQPKHKAAASRSQSNGGETSGKGASAKRSGSPSAAKRGASQSKHSAQSNGQQSRTRGRSEATRSSERAKAKAGASSASSPQRGSSNGSSAAHNGNGNGAKTIGVSVATGTLGAAAGIAGGVLLGRTIGQRPRKVLGVKLPRRQPNFTGAASDVARSITAAGQQLGKLASEVRVAREKAEEIGKVLT